MAGPMGVIVTLDGETHSPEAPLLYADDLAAVRGDGIDPTKWTVTPGSVDITLIGTLLAVEKARAGLHPIVKVSGNDTKARDADVAVEGLPPGIGVKISPERVRVTPTK